MITGAQLIAPEGYLSLSKGITYYFLLNDPAHNRARLVEFNHQGRKIKSSLVTMTTFEFEEGLEAGLIEEVRSADIYPPWLEPIKGVEVSHLENCRRSDKETYDQKVNRRFLKIAGLISRMPEILASDDPDAIINADAKAQSPKQNPARLRLWFYTYITFGRNKWTLMPRFHDIGGWDRDAPCYKRKMGRPSSKGKYSGYRCDPAMREKIIAGYVKFKSAFKTKETVYRNILTEVFGCIATEKGSSVEFRHPKGSPYPSISQVSYWIKKTYDERTRSIEVRGKHKTRARLADEGSFSERLLNVNQRIEFDGYNISQKLTGLTEGSAVDSFCVVRAVCVLSGAIVGIGFSEGKENLAAYRMCLFSMAQNKVRFCKLFGVDILPEDWPCEGLSGGIVFDRGPGAAWDVEPEIHWLGTFEMTPTFSGQSKASVESSHPRDKKTLDQPTSAKSGLNFVEMCKREIFQVVEDNKVSDASGRMEERMYAAGVVPSPLGVWNYWSSRGRDSSIGMLFDDAVKNFLLKLPGKIRQDAVYLYGRKYRSADLVATCVFDRVAKSGVIPTEVYVLTMCMRYIWIEFSGVLYQLGMVRTQRTLDGDIDISLWDLEHLDKLRRESIGAHRDARPATVQHTRDRLKQQTGKDWDEEERTVGRFPKNEAHRRDTDDYERLQGKRK